ncbi:hypothetical protein BSZ39_07255 [Bowdeniella nasicola]|uniref:Uncharacterized protein n=1 Tax=Bowdeniella nasicola TaxID=208480 RepID=A0A1Q5Q1W7_9ACTO|nr:hypothetical protein [Bowdeniella nasicola]OKL53841.1 hypothetical protein BSZ39_07255 [Bowdeniella nasicola]
MFNPFSVDAHLAKAEANLATVIATLENSYPEQWVGSDALAYRDNVTDTIAAARSLTSRIGYLRARVAS